MILGVVGSGADKFTRIGEAIAKKYLTTLLIEKVVESETRWNEPLTVCSGHSIMGGIDVWVEEMAKAHNIATAIKAPKTESWMGNYGYKARNLDIAKSDEVYVIVADTYPPDYKGERFKECYHCHTSDHAKSGACWTGLQALKMGKKVVWILVHNDGSGANRIR
jgi:hypothetical protein